MKTVLDRLEIEIATESGEERRACLSAKMACYLARSGDLSTAQTIVESLRAKINTNAYLELTCWLCLADGLILFFDRPSSNAFDRIRRAYHLSRTLNGTEIAVASAAWLGHIEFNRSNINESCRLNLECLSCASRAFPGVLSRTALTLADMHHWAGDPESAAKWYAAARNQALQDGDRVGFSAVLHNFAVLRVHAMRLSRAADGSKPSPSDLTEITLNSSRNYDSGIHLRSLPLLEPLMRSQLLVIQGRYSEALNIISSRQEELGVHGLNRYRALTLADKLLCEVQLSTISDLRESESSILAELDFVTHADDKAIIYSVLAEACSLLNESGRSMQYASLSLEAIYQHRIQVDSVIARLRECRLLPSDWSELYDSR